MSYDPGLDTRGVVRYFFDRPGMRVCLSLSPEVAFQRDVILHEVESVFDNWAAYLESKQVVADYIRQLQSRQEGGVGSFPAPFDEIPITTRPAVTTECVGNEELRIHFGQPPQRFRAIKRCLPQLTGWDYIPDLSESGVQGLLWVESLNFGTRMHLMHQIGHYFGNFHLDGTIMSSQVGPNPGGAGLESIEALQKHANQIDWSIELASGPISSSFRVLEGIPLNPGNGAFRALTGRDAAASVRTRLDRLTLEFEEEASPALRYSIELAPDPFSVRWKDLSFRYIWDAVNTPYWLLNWFNAEVRSEIYTGVVRPEKAGPELQGLPIVMTRNHDQDSMVQILVLNGDAFEILFSTPKIRW
jgi:hypothetical protein